MKTIDVAPGRPGIDARWTSSAKAGVGTAIGARSRVWYTISHGILNEIYYPHVDQANTRDLGLIVTGDRGFFSEEKRHTHSSVSTIAPGVPAFRVVNTCRDGRYRITKTILADPERDVVLQDIRFDPLVGTLADYRLYALLAPHLANQGAGNSAWLGDYMGIPMLFAQRDSAALALLSSEGFVAASCGYVGKSDGWQQLRADGCLAECYRSAPDGNVALTGQIDLERCNGHFVLALAFGRVPEDAGQNARGALICDFGTTQAEFIEGWNRFHENSLPAATTDGDDVYRLSVAVLQVHEDKGHRGGVIASLSIPWGSAKGDHDLGGYHVVWPRDLVECAEALSASGHAGAARNALRYLMVTQNADGHWPQNMWLDGRPYWTGNQLDETAFPILLADHLSRRRMLGKVCPWPMVRLAASYLVRQGPVTPEDRWEEDGGYSTFTLAVLIAALLAAADFADAEGEHRAAGYLRDTADVWHDSLDRWTYVTNTTLAKSAGVDGYYARIAPPDVDDPDTAKHFVMLRNQPPGARPVPYGEIVSPDVLQLVRFGLRAPDDSRILNTIRVIDRVLRTDTRTGPVWHRYNDDGYGEHDDGAPFDGTGIGRGWPLLAGERAHYAIAAGRLDEAKSLLDVMRRQTSPGGLIPEQVWDAADILERELFNGCPSGSAMPLAWAHAEYVKLVWSLENGRVFDMPPQARERYLEKETTCRIVTWRFNNKRRSMPCGRTLRIEAQAPVVVRWTADGWKTRHDIKGEDTTIGVWIADLPTDSLGAGCRVDFTFCWPEARRWEGENFSVVVADQE